MTQKVGRDTTTRPIDHVCHGNGCHFLKGRDCTCGLERLDRLFYAARELRNEAARDHELGPYLANLFTAVRDLEGE